jgi:hypothetical protein
MNSTSNLTTTKQILEKNKHKSNMEHGMLKYIYFRFIPNHVYEVQGRHFCKIPSIHLQL